MPQNLGISSTTFFPFTLHKTQELGSLAVEFLFTLFTGLNVVFNI